MLFDRSGKGKRLRELRGELKELKKTLLASGCEKAAVAGELKTFEEALELGGTLQTDYAEAVGHLTRAREAIMKLLDCMGESPAEEVHASLDALMADLTQVHHDCLLREDDTDFQSTVQSLKRMVAQYEENVKAAKTATGNTFAAIMLRSELENVSAVLDDAAGWREPDFLALAYFFQHEDKAGLRDMENGQRNIYIQNYLEEHFMRAFLQRCSGAGAESVVQTMIQNYVYG